MNLSDEPYMLYKNIVAAMYESVEIGKQENVKSLSTDGNSTKSFSHVEELLNRCSEN